MGKLDIYDSWTYQYRNTQKKTETLSNKVIYHKYFGNPVAFNLAERAWISPPTGPPGGQSSAVTEASQKRTVSVSFCRGGCKFRSSAGYRKYSLPSSQSTLILGLRIHIK